MNDADNFISNPLKLEIKEEISINLISSYALTNLMCNFTSKKQEYLLIYVNSSKGIDLYDLTTFTLRKTLMSKSNVFSCVKHLCYQETDYILSSCCKSILLFSSKNDYECLFEIEDAHEEWILACNLYSNQNGIFIISSNNDHGHTKIWDIDKQLIKSFPNNKNRQIYSVELWNNNKYFVLLACSMVSIINLNSGELFRSFDNKLGDYNYNCCFYERNKTNYMVVSGNSVCIYDIDGNSLIKKLNCISKGLIKWNEKFVISVGAGHLNIIDIEENMISITNKFHKEETLCILKIIHPKFGECLITSKENNIIIWSIDLINN